jgi:hypothetical protein
MASAYGGGEAISRTVRRSQQTPNSMIESAAGIIPDPGLYAEKKSRLLELLAIFTRQGHLTLEEVNEALGRPAGPDLPKAFTVLQKRVWDLDVELRWERAVGDFLEGDAAELEGALGKERERVRRSMARIARLEQQLQDARRTAADLVAASKNSLTTLRKVRTELVEEEFAREALNPLLHDLRQVAETVQELNTLAYVRAAAGPVPPRHT